MSYALPEPLQNLQTGRRSFQQFGGYTHVLGAQDGQIWDERNMTSDHSPVLATRPPRYKAATLKKPNGLYSGNALVYVDGTNLIVNGQTVGQVQDSPKRMYGISGRVIIWPDKLLLTADNTLEPLETTCEVTGLTIGGGTYAGQPAEYNSLTTAGDPFPFRAGDAITIEGCTKQPANNKTPIVREISEDGKTLRFYEHTFLPPEEVEETSYTEDGTVTLKRAVPDLDYICGNENRIWGCKDDTIWCSKLGDPYNWYCFDGLATDSWSVDSGTPGKFTACCSYLGYPIFFKEDMIFKVYGDKPTNFQLMSSATLGVMEGSAASLAIAGETLYYLSRAGITAYSGGIPQSVSAALGTTRYKDAVGGSDGTKYIVSMLDTDGESSLFAYDPVRDMWCKEDDLRLIATAYKGGLYGLEKNGGLYLLETPTDIPEDAEQEAPFRSLVEFSDFDFDSFSSKYAVRVWIRYSGDAGTILAAAAEYDSSGIWETIATAECGEKKTAYMAISVHRCDHFRLKLEAVGQWRLWAIEYELYSGDYHRKEARRWQQ